MKILFIISSLGGGGAERVVSLLANQLSDMHDITIGTFSSEKSVYPLCNNIRHKKLNLLKNSKNIWQKISNVYDRITTLKRFFKDEKPDVIISFMTHTNILSIIASKLNNQKILISEDTSYDFYNSQILFLIRKLIYPFSNFLVVKTIADKQNYNFVKNKVVISNPLPNLIENKIVPKEKIILAVGRLDNQKGFDVLIEVFKQIDTDWKLIIAGDGIEKNNLLSLIDNTTNIKLIGRVDNIFDYYNKSSIFVLSSRREGFGNVLIEAMSCKCAVVSFDCPYGPSEIIENNINGLLIENQNQKELKESIELLIENQNLRDRLANEAIKVEEKYNIDKIAKEWEKIIEKIY